MEITQSQIDQIADAVVAKLAARLGGNINRAPADVEKGVAMQLLDIEPKGEWRNGKGCRLVGKDADGRLLSLMVNYATMSKADVDQLLNVGTTWNIHGDIIREVSPTDGRTYRSLFASKIEAAPELPAAKTIDEDPPF